VSKQPNSAAKILMGVVLFAGLPLLGWSVLDVAGFLSNPARLLYLVVAVLLQIAVVIYDPEIGRSGLEGHNLVRRQRLVLIFIQLLTLAAILIAPLSDHRNVMTLGVSDAVRYFGIALFVAGFIIMSLAEKTLGKMFTIQVVIQQEHMLVQHGLYRFIRHPRYLGILMYQTGMALVFDSGLALILTALLMLVLVWRIHDEEELLRARFGNEWDAYCRVSWRLLPFIY
jgi:protein-S-isoprenylcysteine O-methyltransferase Ste14